MASEMIERVAAALEPKCRAFGKGDMPMQVAREFARAAIEAMRELPSEPGLRYTAGEYSRRTQAAMVDDALSDLLPVYGSRPTDDGEVG